MPVIPTRRIQAVWIAAALLGTGWGLPRILSAASTTASPELDLYLTHNNIFRSRIIAGANWTDTDGRWSSGILEYSVDFGLVSFFRRYMYKDPNPEKTKVFTGRLGYAYLPDFHQDEAGNDEDRGLAELTIRLPIGGQWLYSDRNRGDFRWIGESRSQRYRNRLRAERSMVFKGFKGSPYLSTEVYYDTEVERWNRLELRAGVEIPWRYSAVFEPYFTHQANWQGPPAEIIGFVVQKYMAMPLGGTQ